MAQTIKDRVAEFIYHERITTAEFERRCGLSNGYVSSMRQGFGAEKLGQVFKAFPDLNREWLLFGEGEMLRSSERPSIIQNIEQTNSTGGIHNSAVATSQADKFLDLLARKEESLAKAQEHISQLIKLLGEK